MAVYDPKHPIKPSDDPFHEKPASSCNHCPKCGSTDIRHDIEGDIAGIATSILPGFPNIPGISYVCRHCGNRYTYLK